MKQNQWALKLSTFLVITGCLTVICGALLINKNFKMLISFWGESVQVSAYLEDRFPEKQIPDLVEKINKLNYVKKVDLIDREEAAHEFEIQMAGMSSGIFNDKELVSLIPTTLVATLDTDITPDLQPLIIDRIGKEIKSLNGVVDVNYGSEFVNKFSVFNSVFSGLLYILTILLSFAGLFIFSNAIRASVYQHHEEIQIYELVGATAWTIRKPYLIESGLMGMIAAIVSLAFNYTFLSYCIEILKQNMTFAQVANHLHFFNGYFVVLFILASGIVGSLASLLCVQSINSGWAAARRTA